MAVIYLKHEQHGTKVACAEEEAVADEKKGWKRYEVAAILKPSSDMKKAPVAEVSNELAQAREQYQAKFGRAPHHKKSLETLKAEIEAS